MIDIYANYERQKDRLFRRLTTEIGIAPNILSSMSQGREINIIRIEIRKDSTTWKAEVWDDGETRSGR
jgi:hypothetical protein